MIKPLTLFIALLLSSQVQSNSIGQLETELNQGHYSKASATGLSLLEQQPDNTRLQFLTAVALQNNNQLDNALQLYQKIIHTYPELPEPRNNLALIYQQQGEHEQAIETLIGSLKTHPAYATAWQNLNKIYQGLAGEAYRKALGKDDRPRSAINNIQLAALTTLYDPPVQPAVITATTELASAPPEPVASTPQIASSPAAPVVVTSPAVILAVAATPVAAPPTTIEQPEDTHQQLIYTLQKWADVWSQKDFDSYVDTYIADYQADKSSHQAWLEYRRPRILNPQSIIVKLSKFKVKSVSRKQAVVDFHQNFQSPDYSDKVIKRIHLTKTGKGWKISRELTIAVL